MAPDERHDRPQAPSWLSQLLRGIPPHRALVTDLMELHRPMPTVPQSRTFRLQAVREIRDAASRRIAWPVLFLKAFAITSVEFPALRRTYIAWPWPYFYEHPTSVANLCVARTHQGEEWLFFAPLVAADQWALTSLQELVESYQTHEVQRAFNSQFRLAHFPRILRRGVWWLRMNVSPSKRIKRLGTFALTSVARHGVTIVDPKAPVTSTLTYGPFDEDGRCVVTIAYDHRVMDGKEIARILVRLEQVLQTTIAEELRSLSVPSSAQHAA